MKAYRGNGYRVLFDVVRDRDPSDSTLIASPLHQTPIRGAADAVRHFRGLQRLGIVPSEREAFCVLLMDARHRTIGFQVVSIGSLSSATVHPREVFRAALAVAAHSIILAHNHPTGDAAPSVEDRTVTTRLQDAGKILGIEVLDHVVIGSHRYFSFTDGRHFAIEEDGA